VFGIFAPFLRVRRVPGRRAAIACVIAAALVAGCATSERDAAEQAPAASPFVPPDRPGPYRAGRITVVLPEPSPRRNLTVDVWYPVDPADAAGHPAARYEIAPGVDYPSAAAVTAAPVSRHGPFPLVVYSHGSAGISYQSAFLTEALASHGFVVAAPDHVGDTQGEVAAGHQAPLIDLATTRTLDVEATITDVLARSAATAEVPGPDLRGAVDPARVGVLGFSFGGLTALATPTGLLKAPGDPRVRAVVALAPAAALIPRAVLAANRVPTLMIDTSGDTVAPPAVQAIPTWGQLGARPKYRVDLVGGSHNAFSDICVQAPAIRGRSVPRLLGLRISIAAAITCRQPGISVADTHRITIIYAVSFLRARLDGDHRYDRYLTPAFAATLRQLTFTAAP
jgi:predicted dienelactone hydrolase